MISCHVCGSAMNKQVTSLPFKVSELTIVILKSLPVLQCSNCSEYLLEDHILEKVEDMLKNVNSMAELEIINFAA